MSKCKSFPEKNLHIRIPVGENKCFYFTENTIDSLVKIPLGEVVKFFEEYLTLSKKIEQQKRVEDLEKEVEELKKENSYLKEQETNISKLVSVL